MHAFCSQGGGRVVLALWFRPGVLVRSAAPVLHWSLFVHLFLQVFHRWSVVQLQWSAGHKGQIFSSSVSNHMWERESGHGFIWEKKSVKVGCAYIYAHVFVLLCHCRTQTWFRVGIKLFADSPWYNLSWLTGCKRNIAFLDCRLPMRTFRKPTEELPWAGVTILPLTAGSV